MSKALLSNFQVFLIARRLTDEKHAPFYARWVSKFIAGNDTNAEKTSS